ncbi:AAA family ATPase [Glutamicibacter sp.]|uniref:AAA family ATPase n=1 Tax=Glutamicibacter sp. TaxID=1931995 RepID=UPI0028BDFBFC|nr:AAA family ATPase [Glutamicibacter sp.]
MYKKFEWIRECGFFEDYRWDGGLPPFQKINVIFGSNGTGKTSLSGAFYGLRGSQDSNGPSRVSVVLDSEPVTITDGADNPIFDRTFIFSEEFVARSHNFTSGSADMPAVLTIGERTNEAEVELETLRKERDDALELEKSHRESAKNARSELDATFGTISQQVVDAASRAEGRWRSRGSYSSRVVRTAYEGSHSGWTKLGDEELQVKIGIVNSDKAELIDLKQIVVATAQSLEDRAVSALGATPTNILLDSLAAHPQATNWVNEGRGLHENIDECIFCGSDFTVERRNQINGHFSDAVKALERDLAGLIRELEELLKSIQNSLTHIPAKGLFFEDLRSQYDSAEFLLKKELENLHTWAVDLKNRLIEKSGNVLQSMDSSLTDAPVVKAMDMLRLRREHNDRVEQHSQQVQDAARSIESHYLKAAEESVGKYSEIAKSEATKADQLQAKINKLKARITTLENVEGDPQPSAKVLTEEVARLLGRRELEFQTVEDRYHVTRNGKPAIGLSLGERTAITLVHFFEMIARFDLANGKPIVVVDDPVSSLDSDIFMGVSTYIWNETIVKDHISQLFLLTHNFELFRQWDIQIEALHRSGKIGGIKAKELYSASFYEIKPKIETKGRDTRRRPHLAAWPPSDRVRKMVRSTYHQAFMAVADAQLDLQADDSMEKRLSAQLLFPNVVRRMLETFLAFKHPEWVGDFGASMRKSAILLEEAKYPGDANALRLRLTRYAHAHSHSETPATDIVVSPDEVFSAISAAFEFMNTLDPAHFAGLCEVANIDPKVLLSVGDTLESADSN